MTPEEKRIAIAEECGWKDIKHTFHEEADIENRSITHWSGLTGIPPEFIHYQNRIRIPDYLNDLNAMHEAEKTMTDRQKDDYRIELAYYYGNGGIFATAAQRADTFLYTIGKLEE